MGIIESRVEELHLLGISHNDVRLANIHVSVSGKFFFIDLDYRTAQIKNNFKSLYCIFGKYGEDGKHGSGNNSTSSEVFDEVSIESLDKRTTKEGIWTEEFI